MTRLLFPEAFGLIAAATSLLIGLALVSDVGIRTVILRSSSGDDPNFLRFAWSLQLCRGIALWGVLAILCLVLSLSAIRSLLPTQSVFADVQFPWICMVLGLGLVLSGFESTALHLSVRKLDLRPIIFLDVIARLASFPVMLVLAWFTRSVWAIVAGSILASAIRLILTHVTIPGPRMSWRWDQTHLPEFIQLGKWISLSSAATFISGQGDRLFIGLFLSGSVLGLYSVAKVPLEALTGLFEKLNSSVGAPVLGEVVRNDQARLRDKYYRFRLPFDLSAPFLGGFVLASGALLIHGLYDARYAQAGLMLQLLALGLVLYPSSLVTSAFSLVGSPHLAALISAVQAVALFGCMLVGLLVDGVVGVVAGIALHRVVPTILVLILGHRRGWIDFWKELRVIPVFAVGVAVGSGATWVANYLGL